jgi:hypothetical protein
MSAPTPHEILSPLLADSTDAPGVGVVDTGIIKVAYRAAADLTPEQISRVNNLLAHTKGVHTECNLLDGKEHSYFEVGAWIGDQQDALVLMGWLEHMGRGEVIHPNKVLPAAHADIKAEMMRQGLVTFRAKI